MQIKVFPFLKDEQAHISFLNDRYSEIFSVNLEQSLAAAFDNLEEKLTLVVNRNANYQEWKTPQNSWITNVVKNCVAKKAKLSAFSKDSEHLLIYSASNITVLW